MPSMVVTMPGEVPQVTVGASVAASMWSSRSKVAPSSVTRARQCCDGESSQAVAGWARSGGP